MLTLAVDLGGGGALCVSCEAATRSVLAGSRCWALPIPLADRCIAPELVLLSDSNLALGDTKKSNHHKKIISDFWDYMTAVKSNF